MPVTPQLDQTYRAGSQTACLWSGALAPSVARAPGAVATAGHVLLYSGGGRLNSVLVHQALAAAPAVYFYDSVSVTVSGVSVSGQLLIGMVPVSPQVTASGQATLSIVSFAGEPIRPEMPFFSGLCVAYPSGCPGITVSFTPA